MLYSSDVHVTPKFNAESGSYCSSIIIPSICDRQKKKKKKLYQKETQNFSFLFNCPNVWDWHKPTRMVLFSARPALH